MTKEQFKNEKKDFAGSYTIYLNNYNGYLSKIGFLRFDFQKDCPGCGIFVPFFLIKVQFVK